jgi:hypothetical protein
MEPASQASFGDLTTAGKSEARPVFESRIRISGDAQSAREPASVPSSSTCRFLGARPVFFQSTNEEVAATRRKLAGAWLFQAARPVMT